MVCFFVQRFTFVYSCFRLIQFQKHVEFLCNLKLLLVQKVSPSILALWLVQLLPGSIALLLAPLCDNHFVPWGWYLIRPAHYLQREESRTGRESTNLYSSCPHLFGHSFELQNVTLKASRKTVLSLVAYISMWYASHFIRVRCEWFCHESTE